MKKVLFWVWNVFFLAAAGLGVGVLSLFFAAVDRREEMFYSYLAHPLITFLNLAPVVLCLLALWFLTGRPALSYGITAGVTLALTAVSWFKLQFRNDPLLFEDLLLVKEAGDMAGKYQPHLNRSMAAGLALVLAGLVLLLFCVRARPGVRTRFLGLGLTLCLAMPLADTIKNENVYNNLTVNPALVNRWSATEVYTSKGFVYPFLHSAKGVFGGAPEDYDPVRAQTILAAYSDVPIPQEKKVNVISIMLEAYSDFSRYEQLQLDPKVYADYHALEAEGVSGTLVDNIFAGGTVDTERLFLTGLSKPGSLRVPTNAYPWYFQTQGYYVTGGHGSYSWFYNRENANRNLGFTDYKFVEEYFSLWMELYEDKDEKEEEEKKSSVKVAYDKVFFPAILWMWVDRPQGQPFFAYDLTYQGHGPYDDDIVWWENGYDYLIGGDYTQAERNILNNYFGSIYDTNCHLREFFDYFREQDEPVVLVVFGDHNPWLGDGNSVYHTLGINLDLDSEEGFYNYYSTRYLIWANDAAKAALGKDFSGEGPTISPNFLMAEVFRQCGWEGPVITQASQQVMDRVGVMNTATGLYVENGVLTEELTPEGAALVSDYDMVQYYYRQHFRYGEPEN